MSESLGMTCARNPAWAAEEIERLRAQLAKRAPSSTAAISKGHADSILSDILEHLRDLKVLGQAWADTDVDDRNAIIQQWRRYITVNRPAFAASAIVPKTSAVYLIDGVLHRPCDCDTMKGECPRGAKRQLQTTQLSRCFIPAAGVVIV